MFCILHFLHFAFYAHSCRFGLELLLRGILCECLGAFVPIKWLVGVG